MLSVRVTDHFLKHTDFISLPKLWCALIRVLLMWLFEGCLDSSVMELPWFYKEFYGLPNPDIQWHKKYLNPFKLFSFLHWLVIQLYTQSVGGKSKWTLGFNHFWTFGGNTFKITLPVVAVQTCTTFMRNFGPFLLTKLTSDIILWCLVCNDDVNSTFRLGLCFLSPCYVIPKQFDQVWWTSIMKGVFEGWEERKLPFNLLFSSPPSPSFSPSSHCPFSLFSPSSPAPASAFFAFFSLHFHFIISHWASL